MEKINYKKVLKHLYHAKKTPDWVDVPVMNYLMIHGKGDPNTAQSYADAIQALFSVSYTLKFMIKKGPKQIDYGVMPLEGLWWVDDLSTYSQEDKSNWKWTAMIMQPEFISEKMVQEAIQKTAEKKELPALPLLEFRSYSEGKAAQIMHIGPFSEEGPTIERLHQFIEDNGFQLHGKHHEIYLTDFRRAAPENLKTIIRQPYRTRSS